MSLELIKFSEHLESIAEYIPGNVYWMDRQGYYCGCNAQQVKFFHGRITKQEFVGSCNQDFVKKGLFTQEEMNAVNMINQKVMDQKQVQTVQEYFEINHQLVVCVSHKFPILDQAQKVVGLFGISVVLASDFGHLAGLKGFSQYAKRYYLSGKNSGKYLTKRELECLEWIFKGYNTREIANFLSISARTVEMHIDHLKEKLACSTRSELIQAGIESGAISVSLPFLRFFNLQP